MYYIKKNTNHRGTNAPIRPPPPQIRPCIKDKNKLQMLNRIKYNYKILHTHTYIHTHAHTDTILKEHKEFGFQSRSQTCSYCIFIQTVKG
jgi:hypothetical protein